MTGDKEEKDSGVKNASSQAKYQLGVMYYDGLGVKENQVSLACSPTPLLCAAAPPTYLLLHFAGKRLTIHATGC